MYQRLRDPVHDLIEFEDNTFERLIWSLLDTVPFQRLRRVRQLGFSDLVFPGATHSRFAHSVGVFHTARQLRDVLKLKLGNEYNEDRANVAVCAALVHDLGHGPFSHAFEQALGEDGKHEEWTARIILETEVGDRLGRFKRDFDKEVAAVFQSETLPDIYSSIVTSQFDADRLDYMRRDRMMTGTRLAGIDFTWLSANLEVDTIEVGSDDQKFAEIATFVLGPKSIGLVSRTYYRSFIYTLRCIFTKQREERRKYSAAC
jgi:HD superfamily phosphohydrolase